MLSEIITDKLKKTKLDNDVFRPVFFRLQNQNERALFYTLLNEHSNIKLYDTIAAQLRELILSSNPTLTLSQQEVEERVQAHLNGIDIADYGVWVYYPWNEKIVHLLDEQEFVFMRTNRNKYKITSEEEAVLATKIVGVVGLSVGQAVSVTMSMERTFGELRIADFDELEITNLNRLRSGVHNMGIKKTIQVARDIAEIDPYLKITLFSDGLTRDNMDAFFTEGGKLDIIIDECDGLDMKILLRHKAKALGIPVLMEASDRGTVDVERFDLEPNRPILHGFIDHLDHTKVGSLTNEEKIPYILPMLGVETISKRLKASMVEIKQTISTWPQLASGVALGGAICADVCRRILLDKYHESGRYFIDIEELIGNKETKMEGEYDIRDMVLPELTRDEMMRIAGSIQTAASQITAAAMREVVDAGINAPSAANNQPWKFLEKDNVLFLFHDKKQSYSWTDEKGFIAQISLGAALENVLLKAASLGYSTTYSLYPAGPQSALVATVSFTAHNQAINGTEFAAYIGKRCTNRKKGDTTPIEKSVLEELAQSALVIPGTTLSFLDSREDVNTFADIESAAERIRFMHPQSHSEFFNKEVKWNDSGKEIITEGLDIKTFELSLSDETGIKVAADPGVIALLNKWKTGKAFEKQIRLGIRSASTVGLVTVPEYTAANIVNGGRAAERLWLNATKYNLSLQPMSAPLFLYARLKYGSITGVTEDMKKEVNMLYENLVKLFPELPGKHGLFLFRLFKSDPPTARSLRKNIEELYVNLKEC